MTERPLKVMTLSWGVKESFRRYVEGVGGAIETDAGAERTADGSFTFAASARDGDLSIDADGKLQGHAKFLGEVRFDAHGGMLKVRLVDPVLEISPTGAALTVAGGVERDARLPIAKLDLKAMSYAGAGEVVIPAKLTMDGAYLLGDNYPAMTPIDPVRLILAGPY